MVCTIRDCFGKYRKFGYPVLAKNGKMTKLCFDRRQSDEKTKAYINPKSLDQERWYKYFGTKHENLYTKIQSETFGRKWNLPKVAVEDLWAFYIDDRKRSLQAWKTVIESWNLPYDESKVSELMDAYIDEHGRHAPSHHNDTIYNLEELLSKFGKDETFRKYVRI